MSSVQLARMVHEAVLLVNGRSAVRIRSPAPRGLHVSVGLIFTFGSDISGFWWPVVWCRDVRAGGGAWSAGLSCVRACSRLVLAAVLAGGDVRGARGCGPWRGQGGTAASPARVLRRFLRVFGGSPAAARRVLSCCRVFQAARMGWLRTMSRVVVNSISGVRPMRRHQPRVMSLVAGSLAVAKPRSAPVRRV